MMYDIDAFKAESTTASYQQALDTLYSLGCKYSITDADMRPLCDQIGVDWEDLQNHNSANSTKETQCQSQQ
jgi:hypothetical protein